jgi:hypothetical protein
LLHQIRDSRAIRRQRIALFPFTARIVSNGAQLVWIGSQYFPQRGCKLIWLRCSRQEARDLIFDHLRYAADRECGYRQARRESLEQHTRHSFLLRWDHQNVESAHHGSHVLLPIQKFHRQIGGKAKDFVVIYAISK